jgi:hypothetical protein
MTTRHRCGLELPLLSSPLLFCERLVSPSLFMMSTPSTLEQGRDGGSGGDVAALCQAGRVRRRVVEERIHGSGDGSSFFSRQQLIFSSSPLPAVDTEQQQTPVSPTSRPFP